MKEDTIKIAGKYFSTPIPILNINDTNITDPQRVADNLVEAFASVSQDGALDTNFKKCGNATYSFCVPRTHPYNEPFSIAEIHHSLRMASKSTPMIKRMHPTMANRILDFFSHTFARQEFSSISRTAITKPLDYRPMSLTSCPCKLVNW